MSNCPGCDNSSTTYSRCNPPVSTNCVFYQGESKVCSNDTTFTICKGDNLSNVQLDIFDKVCKLSGAIDVTKIQLPLCAKEGWETNDPTILNLLKYILDLQCQQKTLLEEVDSYVNNKTIVGSEKTIDPFVKVCLACCTPGCTTDTPVVLLLSEALAAIVSCVCTAKTEAANALTIANEALSSVNILQGQISNLNKAVCNLNGSNANMICRVNKLEVKTISLPCPSTNPSCLPCVSPTPIPVTNPCG